MLFKSVRKILIVKTIIKTGPLLNKVPLCGTHVSCQTKATGAIVPAFIDCLLPMLIFV